MFMDSILRDDAADRIIHHFIILKCSGQVLPPAVCGCNQAACSFELHYIHLKYFHLFGIKKLLGATLCNPSLIVLATADSYTHSTQGRKHNNQEVTNEL